MMLIYNACTILLNTAYSAMKLNQRRHAAVTRWVALVTLLKGYSKRWVSDVV